MTVLDLYLGGDKPTLVRYSIIFTKPGLQVSFQERHELVANSIRLLEYSGLAIAEFMSEAAAGLIQLPSKWRDQNYPMPAEFPGYGHGWHIPEEDVAKYLKFYCHVAFQGKRLEDLDSILGGDRPTVIRYRILFTKPGYEYVFPEYEDLLTERKSLFEHGGWAIADFMRQVAEGGIYQAEK